MSIEDHLFTNVKDKRLLLGNVTRFIFMKFINNSLRHLSSMFYQKQP